MPIYEYRCRHCQHRFDKLVPMGTNDSEVECPVCHERGLQKVVSVFGTKGSDTRSSASTRCAPAPGGG
jgi:putative FmdB family regulatory protein